MVAASWSRCSSKPAPRLPRKDERAAPAATAGPREPGGHALGRALKVCLLDGRDGDAERDSLASRHATRCEHEVQRRHGLKSRTPRSGCSVPTACRSGDKRKRRPVGRRPRFVDPSREGSNVRPLHLPRCRCRGHGEVVSRCCRPIAQPESAVPRRDGGAFSTFQEHDTMTSASPGDLPIFRQRRLRKPQGLWESACHNSCVNCRRHLYYWLCAPVVPPGRGTPHCMHSQVTA